MSDLVCPKCSQPKAPTNRLCSPCWRAEGGRRWSDPDRNVGYADGPPRRGVGDLVGLALVALDLDTVRRSTIRALCPAKPLPLPDGRLPKGSIPNAINRAYRRYEANGWVTRDGAFVHVHDRQGLRRWIDQGVDSTDERAAAMLALGTAVEQINARLDEGSAVSAWDAETARRHAEVRRQELIALTRLMKSIPGGTARPGTRIVPRGRVL